MAETVWGAAPDIPVVVETRARHSAVVRVTHWLTTIAFLALLVSGVEILLSHPRFYWGETGNVMEAPLFSLHLPASRATVPTGYGYVLPDQNGWSRYLHFQAAWLAVLTGLVYAAWGLASGYFRRALWPDWAKVSGAEFRRVMAQDLRISKTREEDAWTYNVLQRLTYLGVIFVLFPLVIWTGLAMSPAVAAAVPWVVTVWGGQESARTIHFVITILLTGFLVLHVAMVVLAGFGKRMRAMITGRV